MSFGNTMLHVMLLPEKMSAIGQLVKYVVLLVLFVWVAFKARLFRLFCFLFCLLN